MTGERPLAEKRAAGDGLHAEGTTRPHRRPKAGLRNQAKFSRPVRLALWLGLPIGLWSGIYLLVRLFQ